jgi:DNA/RNA-binding domain of Phe-tRNA-synthetase-like protein
MSIVPEVSLTDAWRAAFPGGQIGVLALAEVTNPPRHPALDVARSALEEELRATYAGFTRPNLRALPVLHVYDRYYRRFTKTYHVQLQLESVVMKGKPIGSVATLVETMLMSELRHHLLTAVHDPATIVPPVAVDVAREPLPYTLANGRDGRLQPGDMYMADAEGVICSIIYGQDARTRVTPETTAALFVVYAPPGITPALIDQHFNDITAWVRLVDPAASVDLRVVLPRDAARADLSRV